jgi:adenylyltransferase and sulfurtransferase
LISDTAVLLGKPVVSASALRTDGQLMVLNNPSKAPGDIAGGPCYRCVFPKPPPADSVVSCADGGILGPVVGTMGVLQSLEAIKLITRASFKHARNGAIATDEVVEPESHSLHIFSAYAYPPFRTIRLRSRRNNCAVCSAAANITLDTIRTGLTDYVRFCGSATSPQILSMQERISPAQLRSSLSLDSFTSSSSSSPPFQSPFSEADPYILIDVRDKTQYEICSLPKSVNIPISTFTSWTPPTVQPKTARTSEKSLSVPAPGMSSSPPETNLENKEDEQEWNKDLPEWLPQEVKSSHPSVPIYVVCRQGNDSQIVVQKLKEMGLDRNGKRFIGDIRDGFRGWKREVDPSWPEY